MRSHGVTILPNKGALPATSASDRAAALTLARCIRSHGVPQFPDPAFTPPRSAAPVLVMRGMVFAIPALVDPKVAGLPACGPGVWIRASLITGRPGA